jgi:hypothetical protein
MRIRDTEAVQEEMIEKHRLINNNTTFVWTNRANTKDVNHEAQRV